MKNNLLKNAILASFISSALVGCGVDEGLNYNLDSTETVEMDSTTFTISTNETDNENDVNRYLTVKLLQGVSSRGVILTEDSTGIFIQDTVESWIVSPVDRNLNFNGQSPILLKDNELIVDTYLFDEEVNSGETAIYTLSYWINNGYEFTCANMAQHPLNCTEDEVSANPNRRILTLEINALPDPIESISLSDFSIPLDDTIVAPLAILPSYTARQDLSSDFTWSVPDNNGIASVDDSGNLTGLALGSTTLTVTSVEIPSLTVTVTITVTNPPKNVASISLKTPNGNDVTGTISVPTCTSYDFTVVPAKQDAAQPFSGDFVYSYNSTETLPAVTFESDVLNLDPTTKQQPAYFAEANVANSADAIVSLNGSTSSLALTIQTLKNVQCAATLSSVTGMNMLNEDFKVFEGGKNVFKPINGFIRNGGGTDDSVDSTAAFSIAAGMGKHGSDGIQFTADGTDSSAIMAYDKNLNRGFPNLSLDAGGDFKLSFWIKNNNATPLKIENSILMTTQANGSPVASSFDTVFLDQQGTNAIDVPANADWQLIEVDFTGVPALTNERVKWDMIFVPSATDGSAPIDVYIDDISIAELTD